MFIGVGMGQLYYDYDSENILNERSLDLNNGKNKLPRKFNIGKIYIYS